MLTQNKINSVLEHVLQSKEFSESQTYQKLLRYLVQSSLDEKAPKEIVIAHEVFGSSLNPDTGPDTKVRVYIHNLRKKLDSYYLHEGKADALQFEIPKGRYRVKFIEKGLPIKKFTRKSVIVFNLAFLLVLVAVNLAYYLYTNASKSTKDIIAKNNIIWENFIQSKLPILIVFGDYYLFKDRDIANRPRYIRDYQINSTKDLEIYVSKHKAIARDIVRTKHTLLGKFAPWCLKDLLAILSPYKKTIELKLASNLQWADLNKYNLIYVGSFKSLGILNELVTDLSFNYQIYPNVLFYYNQSGDTLSYATTSPTSESDFETDYAAVIKRQSPNRNSMMIIASTRDIGSIATIKYLTDPKLLDQFINRLMKKAPPENYFESIFEVQGFERNVISTIPIQFQPINPKITVSQP